MLRIGIRAKALPVSQLFLANFTRSKIVQYVGILRNEVDKESAARTPAPGEAWPSVRAEGIKAGKPGHELSAPAPDRLSVDGSRRLGKPKRIGEDDEDDASN